MGRGHVIGLNHHRLMLADRVRMEAYEAAIAAQVRPGMRVLDLGTGTGVLGLWAARAGARVVAVEPHEVIAVARRVAAANGLAEAIEFVQADSREVSLSEPVDLVVTECMGNFFVTDAMQAALRDLPRLLRPGGATIPRGLTLHLAGAWLPTWPELRFWESPVGGFGFGAAADFAGQQTYVVQCEPELVITRAAQVAAFPLVQAPDTLALRASMGVTQAATLDALVGWFEAELGAGVLLTTRPGVRTHWGQMVFPLPPTRVEPGDEVEVALDVWTQDQTSGFAWRGAVRRGAEVLAAFDRDTRRRFGG